ncbi:MAG: sigma-54-dependent transcriptional regulator [Gemmataceae bacterium]
MASILVVDQEEPGASALTQALRRRGHNVVVMGTVQTTLDWLEEDQPDAIVLELSDKNSELLPELRRHCEQVPVIVTCGDGSLETAVTAFECGAFDYLAKPFDLQQCLDTIDRCLHLRRVAPDSAAPAEMQRGATALDEIVGQSLPMQLVFKRIALVAPRDDTCVLITGESGSGKEMVARAVHRHSPRRDKPFLPIHIASLSPSLVESELFGHARGAFTGADETRPGLLQLADGGTVLIDELGDIPLPVQVKLLRVLEHNEVLPVGSNRPQPLDVRILSATHQDLMKKVSDGSFRHDLYYRLNVFQIHLPPLRERLEDIVPLTEHFLARFDARALPLLPETVKYLNGLRWIGNIRELRNALEHAVIVAHGCPLLPEHFPRPLQEVQAPGHSLELSMRNWIAQRIRQSQPDAPSDMYTDMLRELEPVLLEEVLRRVQGNRWVAAQWLGLHRATVRKKISLYNCEAESGA